MDSPIDKWLQIRCVTEGFSERIKTISTGSSRQTSRSGIGSALDAKPIEQSIIVMSWVGSYDFDSFPLRNPGKKPGDCPFKKLGDCPLRNSGTVPELDRETTAMN